MLHQILVLLFSLKIMSCSCRTDMKNEGFLSGKDIFSVRKIAKLPELVNESSGIILSDTLNSFWTMNDSGGEPVLYQVSFEGKLISEKRIEGAKNVDWEDLTKDQSGNLYIGDFGNNAQNRKNLIIYKLKTNDVQPIKFRYQSQNFTPEDEPIYDCEAFFWLNDKLYLFSKDWSKKHFTYLYELPAKTGNYVLEPQARIRLKAQVTSAAVSPSGTEFALLAYGKIFFFGIDKGKVDFSSPKYCMKFAKKQTEALTYLNENTLIVTNEQGNVYLIEKDKKGVSN